MKQALKILTGFCLLLFIMGSCSKDTSPASSDIFVGTYTGTVSYKNGDNTTNSTDGKVTVSKVGDRYDFVFGNGIPDIHNVQFEKSTDNTYISVGTGVTGITIDAHNLKILVSNSDGTWTADCSR